MSVGLLIVSHSAKIAEGVCEIAAQMAPDIRLVPAGGTSDGGIGTSFASVRSGISAAQSGDGVLVFTDVGSAAMVAEAAIDLLGLVERNSIRLLADLPLVEGALAAAVTAQAGGTLESVEAATRGRFAGLGARAAPDVEDAASGEAPLINAMGLHARPAASLAQALIPLDADVEINGVDGKSVMLLMTLGLQQGRLLRVSATGPDAGRAVELVLDQARNGFGEL